jgi:hypothetical protein
MDAELGTWWKGVEGPAWSREFIEGDNGCTDTIIVQCVEMKDASDMPKVAVQAVKINTSRVG